MFAGAGYEVKSNSEQGTGRADVIVKDRAYRRVIVIEVKWSGKEGYSLENACDDALKQIEEKQYMRNFQLEGYTTIYCYGAAFLGKTCLIKLA